MSFGIPAFGDIGRCGVECVVSLIIEGDSFERVFALLNIGARSNFIILEESGSTSFSLRIYINKDKPLDLRKDLALIS